MVHSTQYFVVLLLVNSLYHYFLEKKTNFSKTSSSASISIMLLFSNVSKFGCRIQLINLWHHRTQSDYIVKNGIKITMVRSEMLTQFLILTAI